jgi:hypothetical protein
MNTEPKSNDIIHLMVWMYIKGREEALTTQPGHFVTQEALESNMRKEFTQRFGNDAQARLVIQ